MKKLFLTATLIAVIATLVHAQVGIGTTTPNASSVLELQSTDKALILPRLTTAQRNLIASPVPGMMIFNTTEDCVEIYRTSGWYSICGGSNGGGPTDSTSNDVAKANLVAHWTFDDTVEEDSSKATPNVQAGVTTYVGGKINKALQMNQAHLLYPVIPKLNNPTVFANGFTLSFWAQLPNNTQYTSIFQINGNIGDIFGLVGLAHRKNPDLQNPAIGNFDFNGVLTHVNGSGTHSSGFSAHLEGTAFAFTSTEWVFITMVYNDATRTISYYGNGVKYGERNISTTVIPVTEKLEMVTTASNPGTSTNRVSFGALNTNPPFPVGPAPAGWQGSNITGVLDDVRLYNIALTDYEIQTLYNRGNAGK
ncbi:MAG TPA: hypothetical protein PKC39_15640 [Ferruginibacter sp.]|nr:hypothetical protein [Ferruginibacter sp.]HMP22392.1 hypothetical protein [Ferruginibacter sp.]